MPKIVTEHEKDMVREAMFTKGIELIRKKGVKRITVEDITVATHIGKGSFYSYYNSKEELLYSIIKKSESRMFERVEAVLSENTNLKERLVKALKEIYLAADSIVLYVSPSDIELLLRKLPAEVADREASKSNDYFSRTMSLCGIDESRCEMDVLAYLMNALHFVGSKDMSFGERGREKALDILVHAIADYMTGGAEQ
ncbi:TetR family transcriptional regulator [Paenibacillus lautus]|uniref:TetR/AcrR family transcriptional regulator n=1 Tax=Paenibacillus lautus TaxID=1401 RepID=UPI001B17A93C|nr:TetR/AcrR family transcriptional regulator [Paenibacillus lautus]GIO95450.1 TetR family transcriptional regulator [Paenibacillus lautus]